MASVARILAHLQKLKLKVLQIHVSSSESLYVILVTTPL